MPQVAHFLHVAKVDGDWPVPHATHFGMQAKVFVQLEGAQLTEDKHPAAASTSAAAASAQTMLHAPAATVDLCGCLGVVLSHRDGMGWRIEYDKVTVKDIIAGAGGKTLPSLARAEDLQNAVQLLRKAHTLGLAHEAGTAAGCASAAGASARSASALKVLLDAPDGF